MISVISMPLPSLNYSVSITKREVPIMTVTKPSNMQSLRRMLESSLILFLKRSLYEGKILIFFCAQWVFSLCYYEGECKVFF